MISTLGGFFNLNHFDQSSRANDVIVIRHKDGTLHSTPFNVRFGRAQIWSNQGRVVQVEVNGELTTAVMKIGKGGEAYWLQPTYGAFGGPGDGAGRKEQPRRPEAASPTRRASAAADGESGDRNTGSGGDAAMTDEAAEMLQTAGSLGSAVGEGETLSIDDAELQHLPIRPESPPTPPPPPAAAAAAPSSSSSSTPVPLVAPASSPVMPGPPDSATSASPVAARVDGGGGWGGPLAAHHPDSQDSVATLPLLHTADDGHLTVERRAIHSAEDAQEARLALRAMAAAEKSRKRLWRMGLAGDAYLLKSAQEAGQVGDENEEDGGGGDAEEAAAHGEDGGGDAGPGADAQGAVSPLEAAVTAAVHAHRAEATSPSPTPATATAGEEAAAAAAASAAPGGADGAPQRSVTGAPPAAGAAKTAGPAAPPADTARAPSSAASASGSTDSDKVEDEDAYFLDPIEADDDYAAGLYGVDEDKLLGSASFASSVTSGVSLPDVAAGPGYGGGSAASSSGWERGKASAAGPPPATPPGGPTTRLLRPALVPSPSSPPKAAEERRTGPAARDAGDAAAAPTAAPTTSSKSGFTGAASRGANADEVVDAEGRPVQLQPSTGVGGGGPYFTRTLIPVEADLWKLRLREGCNAVRYLARKDKGDIVAVSCNIFLWNWTDRLVVSDVDGTITKSDLLGHFYAMLGKGADWTHPGICNLYSKIEGNGYRMVYLTARSVSQINQTKTYLFTLQQDGVRLPMGPVLTAPQRFFTALTQEVSKQSHVFKIACLTSVRAAFPATTRPFFAGFGNRYNDVISYDAAGISTHKIFIIDPSSVLHVCLVKQTYRDLGHLVDVTFPPVKRHPVVLRAPRHMQRTGEAEAAGGGGGGAAAGAGNASGGGGRSARDRHAYARGLLHRSASASSSSASSVSSVTSDSSDMGEYVSGGASDAGSPLAPSTAPAGGHRGEDGGGYALPRHASAAFSLVNSVRVDASDAAAATRVGGGAGESSRPAFSSGADDSRSAAAAAATAAVPPSAGAQRGTAAIPPSSLPQRPPPPPSAVAAAAVPPAPGTAPATARRTNDRGQRATFSDLNDDLDEHPHRPHGGRGRGAVQEKEEVPADPEFSSYAYWRMDPRDLITAAPAKPTASKTTVDKKTVPATAASTNSGASFLAPSGATTVGRRTPATTPDRSPVHTSVAAAEAPPLSPLPTAAAKASAPGSPSGKSGRDSAAAAAATLVSAYDDWEGTDTGDVALSGAKFELPQPVPGPQEPPPPPPPTTQAAALLPSVGAGKGKPASAAAGRAGVKENNSSSTGGGRGFFSSFSFSRARPVEAPVSPHTQRTAQLREEARQRALAHPDAREYYYTAPAPPPSGSSGAVPAASSKGAGSEPASPKR